MGVQRVQPPSGLAALWERRDVSAATADAVYATLRAAIVHRVLEPGQRLAEEDLARRLDVSRTPVREALLRLQAERLTARAPRGGLVVSTITPAEVLDLYVVRQALDGQAARLAAASASPVDIDHLRLINDRMRQAASDFQYALMAELNLEFHHELCRVGRSPLLLAFVEQVHDRVRRFPGSTFTYPGRAADALSEHSDLIASIEARDPDRAQRTAYEHMGRALAIRLKTLGSPQRVDHESQVAPEDPSTASGDPS